MMDSSTFLATRNHSGVAHVIIGKIGLTRRRHSGSRSLRMISLRRRLHAKRRWLAFALLISPVSVLAQSIQPGKWDVTSTAVDLVVPGAPAFLLRMMKGKSKTERKCLDQSAASTGVAALLVPDPKAQCRVESLQVGAGRYAQSLTCQQKSGPPIRIRRAGTYDASGFAGRLEMAGETPKGPMSMVLDQKATHSIGTCGG